MTQQEIFDTGVLGTIAQGFVHRGSFHGTGHGPDTPCACFYGHQTETDPWSFRALHGSDAVNVNDSSFCLDDFRHRFSHIALKLGLDDSACWWEVEA